MQNGPQKHHLLELKHQRLHLLPQKAIFWEEERSLLLSDLHLGKASHFRKSGIPVPMQVFQKDLDCLSALIDQWQPATICFLGDLFHSEFNQEFDLFHDWMQGYSQQVKFELVRGNHDILTAAHYKRAGIKVYPFAVQRGPFLFTHDPQDNYTGDKYIFSGHIHPCVTLRGQGRQSLSLPCFYFGENQALLPAFGEFTGLYAIRPKKQDHIYVIGGDKVMKVDTQK